jgi:hypothetical protein
VSVIELVGTALFADPGEDIGGLHTLPMLLTKLGLPFGRKLLVLDGGGHDAVALTVRPIGSDGPTNDLKLAVAAILANACQGVVRLRLARRQFTTNVVAILRSAFGRIWWFYPPGRAKRRLVRTAWAQQRIAVIAAALLCNMAPSAARQYAG